MKYWEIVADEPSATGWSSWAIAAPLPDMAALDR